MRFSRVFVLLLIATAMLSPAALAQDDHKFKVSLTFANVSPTAKNVYGVEAQSGAGGELAFEYRALDRMGVEIAVASTSHDVEDSFGLFTSPGTKIAEISQTPLFVNLNVHLVDKERVDFWLGGGLSVTGWGDLEVDPGVAGPNAVDVQMQADYGITLNWGLDIRFGKRWALTLGVRYYEAQLRSDDPNFILDPPVTADPLLGRIGASFRF